MKCQTCTYEVPESFRFCPQCGGGVTRSDDKLIRSSSPSLEAVPESKSLVYKKKTMPYTKIGVWAAIVGAVGLAASLLSGSSPPVVYWTSPVTSLEFAYIQPGTFTMGSPDGEVGRNDDEVQHGVNLTHGFWLGKTEVTLKQWEAVTGSRPPLLGGEGDDLPVRLLSWNSCQKFIQVLCMKEGVPEGTYRLPTEAEWEYACRAGTTKSFPKNIDSIGWYRLNSTDLVRPVGMKKPNGWGLYDMNGNVRELCQDWYGAYPTGQVTDPVGPAVGTSRVCRGGCWSDDKEGCRSAHRAMADADPDSGSVFVGFRLVRMGPPPFSTTK